MDLSTHAKHRTSLAALIRAARGWGARHGGAPTLALAVLVAALAWGGGLGCKQGGDEPEVVNTAPAADAGRNQALPADGTVQLDGRGSYDPDGDAIWFTWSMDSVPPGSEMGPGGARGTNPFTSNNDQTGTSSFSPDRIGTWVVKLVVTDGLLESEPSYVIIDATDPDDRPTANAGADQLVALGDLVTISGSASTDPLGGRNGPLQFQWSLSSAPYNSGLTSTDLVGATAEAASFTPDAAGAYTLVLIVDNGMIDSLPDTVIVDVLSGNGEPIARAGPDLTIPVGSAATLDGSGSFDPDGLVMAYFWELQSKPAGSAANNASFSDRTLVNPVFTPDLAGPYLLSLSVFDGAVWSAPDLVTVTVAATRRLDVFGSVDPGQGTVTADLGAIDCLLFGSSIGSGTCGADLPEGSVVTLTAAPSAGSRFTGWDVQPVPAIDCADTETTCVVTLAADTTVTAVFARLPAVTLTIDGGVTGNPGMSGGRIVSDVGGLDCTPFGYRTEGTCTADVPPGTVITLTALPDAGYTLGSITFSAGQPTCTASPCQVTVTAATTATASFDPPPPSRAVNVNSGGFDTSTTPATDLPAGVAGTIVATSPGAACDFSACAAPNALYLPGAVPCHCYPAETATVVLQATANPGYTFTGWSGDCTSTSATECTVGPGAAPAFVSATFSKP